MAHSQNPFSLDELIQQVATPDCFFISIEKKDLLFIGKQNLGTAKKIHGLLLPENESNPDPLGKWGIKLNKLYDLTVAETKGFNKENLRGADYLEIIAEIGEYCKCNRDKAAEILGDSTQWKEKLSPEIQDKIDSVLIKQQINTDPEGEQAKMVTTLLQNRWNRDWTIEDTISLPLTIFEKFVEYYEGEKNKWPDEGRGEASSPDPLTVTTGSSDVAIEPEKSVATLNQTGKAST